MRYTRELTALLLAPIGIYITIWGHAYVFDATIAVIASLALYEFLDLGRRKGYDIPMLICVLLMLFIIAAFVLEPFDAFIDRARLQAGALPNTAQTLALERYSGSTEEARVRSCSRAPTRSTPRHFTACPASP